VNPSSGVPVSARMRANDAYFELIVDTLDGLEPSARAQFLQRFFFSLAHVDVPENKSIALWDEILARRVQLSERSESPVSVQTALVDVLTSSGMFRVPVVLEYDELKNLHRNAVTDPLTGLYNRRLFDETFDKELNRARRYAHPLSLVTLDLHRFKEVNDKHGHPRGDKVLHAAAATLRKALRTSDSAFRIGGDEFALLLPQTDSAQAAALSRRIGVVFAEFLRPLNLSVSVTMDYGLATYPQDGDQRDQLIRIADERLYRAKDTDHERAEAESGPTKWEQTPSAIAGAQATTSISPAPLDNQPVSEGPVAAEPVAVPSTSQPVPEPPPVTYIPSVPSSLPSTPATEAPPPSISPLETSQPSFPVVAESPRLYTFPRKAERVSMVGTNAYAVLGDQASNRARVVDLGFGGVALDFSTGQGIPETLLAVLHVPILPPVRVSLKRVWTKQLNDDTVRVGCCFIS
jgi:diguanylate cyclase (GGDEF)-like protein